MRMDSLETDEFFHDPRYKKYKKLIDGLLEAFKRKCLTNFKASWRKNEFIIESPNKIKSKVSDSFVKNIVTVYLGDECLLIEVYNGYHDKNNPFRYTLSITDAKLDELFNDIKKTISVDFTE